MEWLIPVFIVLSALLLSIAVKAVFFKRLEVYASKTPWIVDEIILRKLKRWIIPWFLFLGFFLSLDYLPLTSKTLTLFKNISFTLFIFSLSAFFAEVFGEILRDYLKKAKVDIPSVSLLEHLAKWLIMIVGLLIVLHSLGVSISPILTGLGIGGLAIALALQETLSNLFSGLHILLSKQIRPGDYLRLESGEEGYVVDINWRNTVIRELPNNYIIIPNSRLSKAIVKNYYLPEREIAVLVQVGVSYSSDLEKVEKITIEVAKEVLKDVQGGVTEFEPFIRYNRFSDFSIDFTVILRGKEFADQYLIKHEFIKRLHKRYREEGIEIPFPVRTVYIKKHS